MITDNFPRLRSWFRSLRSIWRNQGTTFNAQQGPSENDNSGEIGGRNGPDSSSDSEREHVYDTLGDGTENMNSPQIQIQPQGDRSNVRNRRQGVPPVYLQSQPAEERDEGHTPLETAATKLHKETNQESNPKRNDDDDDYDDVAPQPQPVQEGDENHPQWETVDSKDYEEPCQESSPNRNDDDDDGDDDDNDADSKPQPVQEGDESHPPWETVDSLDYEETNQESNPNRNDSAAAAAAAAADDDDDDNDWKEEWGDGKVDETVYKDGQSTSTEATPLAETTKIDENKSARAFHSCW